MYIVDIMHAYEYYEKYPFEFMWIFVVVLLQVSIYLNWIVRNAAELELAMNSVERVDEFIHLEREVDSHHKGWNFLRIKIKWKEYRKSRNFNEDVNFAL